MPKTIDPAERRRAIAEAVWRVVRRDGLESASVRNVAREAGLSMGSLRHTFHSQAELLVFAMNLVIDRIESRISQLLPVGDPRQDAERFLLELLPLDDERAQENEVWLAFTARAMVDPELSECRDRSYDKMHAGCARWVTELCGNRVDVEVEAARLAALIDGLAVHAAIRPELATAERLRTVLAHHLDLLAKLKPESMAH